MTTYSALKGGAYCCVKLWGISLETDQKKASKSDPLILVMDYAPEGSLTGFLKRNLTGDKTDWRTILSCISDIASGLSHLHSYQVVHRYA